MGLAEAIEARLGYFVDRGQLETLPSPWQVRVGWLAMLPITLSESERERERSRGTWAGQIPIRVPLQLLYCPSQITASTGLTLEAPQIVRHMLSVFHEDAFAGYDLQLLASHPGGLELLEAEARSVTQGRKRWSGALRRVVGGSDYHAALAQLAAAARRGHWPDPLDLDPRFCTLVGFASYCLTLPRWPDKEFYGFDLGRIIARGIPGHDARGDHPGGGSS